MLKVDDVNFVTRTEDVFDAFLGSRNVFGDRSVRLLEEGRACLRCNLPFSLP